MKDTILNILTLATRKYFATQAFKQIVEDSLSEKAEARLILNNIKKKYQDSIK